jgi:hypothetical protein
LLSTFPDAGAPARTTLSVAIESPLPGITGAGSCVCDTVWPVAGK